MQKLFYPVLVLFTTLALFSCSGNADSVEGKIKQYVNDSIVPKLDDPSSFQLVSIGTPDTITNRSFLQLRLGFENKNYESLQNLLQMNARDSVAGALMRDEYLKSKHDADSIKAGIEDIKKQIAAPVQIFGYESKVTFRAKNKMGALVLNNMNVSYHPANDADKRPEYFKASMAKDSH